MLTLFRKISAIEKSILKKEISNLKENNSNLERNEEESSRQQTQKQDQFNICYKKQNHCEIILRIAKEFEEIREKKNKTK